MTITAETLVELAIIYNSIKNAPIEKGHFAKKGTKEYYLLQLHTFESVISDYSEAQIAQEIAHWKCILNSINEKNLTTV